MTHKFEGIGSGMDGLQKTSKSQMRSAIWEMSSSESRGKRAEIEERRGKQAEKKSRAASGPGGWSRKGSVTQKKREERREKRGERDKHDEDERVEPKQQQQQEQPQQRQQQLRRSLLICQLAR